MSLEEFLSNLPVGLVGGFFGGMLGIGGSVVSMPLLDFVHGPNQQLYQASSMVANVCSALSGSRKHRGRGTIRTDLIPTMLPLAGAGAVLGAVTSNWIEPAPLRGVFGTFLCITAILECRGALLKRADSDERDEQALRGTRTRCGIVAVSGGLVSGLLGVGGGVLMVPMLRGFVGLGLRQSIATSSVVMLASTTVGAVTKNATLGSIHDSTGSAITLAQSMSLALPLSIGALIGAALGASCSYRMPLRGLKLVFATLIAIAGARMLLQTLHATCAPTLTS